MFIYYIMNKIKKSKREMEQMLCLLLLSTFFLPAIEKNRFVLFNCFSGWKLTETQL